MSSHYHPRLTRLLCIAIFVPVVAVGATSLLHAPAPDISGDAPSPPPAAPSAKAAKTVIFADGFESGDLSAWTAPSSCAVPDVNLPVPAPAR